jgi:hypothetical protein
VGIFGFSHVSTEYRDTERVLRVDAVILGSSGDHVMQLRIVDAFGCRFESERSIRFENGEARLTITPVVRGDVCLDSELQITIDGEPLDPIPLKLPRSGGETTTK